MASGFEGDDIIITVKVIGLLQKQDIMNTEAGIGNNEETDGIGFPDAGINPAGHLEVFNKHKWV